MQGQPQQRVTGAVRAALHAWPWRGVGWVPGRARLSGPVCGCVWVIVGAQAAGACTVCVRGGGAIYSSSAAAWSY